MGTEASWANTVAGDARLNKMTIIPNTGTYLSGLDKTKHKIVVCTSTGGGYTLDHVYLFTEDGLSKIDLTTTQSHTHGDSTDGGSLERILAINNTVLDLCLTKTTDLYEANWASPVYWNRTVTGTGSVENKTDGTTGERSIRLRPNATSGSGSTIAYPHMKLDFSKTSCFTTKLQIETATNIALHTGVNCDDVTAADSNTVKYQAEVCTATNSNWWLRTASGSANSSSDSGIAISANRVSISLDHDPTAGTPYCSMYVDANNAFQKTTNIPISGSSSQNAVIKHSVKNSTGADRPLLMYGCRLSYTTNDDWAQ